MFKKKGLLLFIVVIFFLILFKTVPDYGINWDEPLHFQRGHAYLHYYLTGKIDFSDLPKTPPLKGDSEHGNFRNAQKNLEFLQKHPELSSANIRRSYYKSDVWTADYWLKNDSGHPPLNGILAALSNVIFYEKLGIMGDVESYHFFEVLTGVILLCVVFIIGSEYGLFTGFISSLALFVYPLFFGEVHFNIKDPPETAFFALTILTFYKAITKKSYKWMLLSSIACGIALSIKFNILFVPLILIPWMLVYVFDNWEIKNISKYKSVLYVCIIFPLLSLLILFATWPYLWQSPIKNLLSIFLYYRNIGSGIVYQASNFYFLGFNTYSIQWITYTTPPVILFFTFLGILYAILNFKKEKNKLSFLFLLWFIIPILRVSLPNMSIYGGVRQIMEYIPGMVLLSGLGIYWTINSITKFLKKQKRLKKNRIVYTVPYIIILLFFIPSAINIIKLHPNENLYFNSLIGGLSGAKNKDIPSWGNSYGNVYLQGINWLNTHAEKDARLALISATMINVPKIWLRSDLYFSNNYFSGDQRDGEYLMDMIYQGFPLKAYQWEYIQTYLIPVYEVKVDGVTVLGIWKNDKEHTRPQYLKEDVQVKVESVEKQKNILKITLDKVYYITKLDLYYNNKDCDPLKEGYIAISLDNKEFIRLPENFPILQKSMDIEPKDKRLVYLFAAKPARYINLIIDSQESCLLKVEKLDIRGF